MKEKWKRALELLGLYLDDMLLLGAAACFTLGAREIGGRPAALLTAGACLTVYAVIVARSRGGRGG